MKELKLNNYMRIIIGIFILISVVLTYYVNKWWLLLTLFIGLNLIQFGFSGFCPLEKILLKLGVKR